MRPRARRPRVQSRLLRVFALFALLGACADPALLPPGSGPGTRATPLPLAARAVGTWTVHDVSAPFEGAVLQIDGSYATLWRECGTLDYAALVGPTGRLRVRLQGGGGVCDVDAGLPWLEAATRLDADGERLVLEGADGTRLATLEHGDTPPVHESIAPELADDPILTDEIEATLTAPAIEVPAGLTPAAEDAVTGRWYPDRHSPADPDAAWLELRADGTWAGSDGCNGQGSVWLLEPSGWFRTGTWAQTEIGCGGVDVGRALASSVALAFDIDGALVALDEGGTTTGRFVRDLSDSLADPSITV